MIIAVSTIAEAIIKVFKYVFINDNRLNYYENGLPDSNVTRPQSNKDPNL